MKQETYDLIEAYMRSCMDDSAHDREHVYRVLYNALEIARNEPDVDWDVLMLLFSLMTVVAGLRRIGLFDLLLERRKDLWS